MEKERIFITGADGFIGSHLTESLVREGYSVRAFVMYNSFNSWGWLDHCGDDVKGKFEVPRLERTSRFLLVIYAIRAVSTKQCVVAMRYSTLRLLLPFRIRIIPQIHILILM